MKLWRTYFDLYPADEAADYRAGVQAAASINSMGGWKGKKAARPEDFFPWLRREDEGPEQRWLPDGEALSAKFVSMVTGKIDPTEDE